MPWHLRMLINLSPFIFAFQLYTGWRLSGSISDVFSLSLLKTRMAIVSFIIILNLLPILIMFFNFSGNLNSLFIMRTELTLWDYLIVYPYWWGLILVVELLPLFITLDIIALITHWFKMFAKFNVQYWIKLVKIGFTIFFMVYVGFRIFSDTSRIRVNNTQIKIPELSSSLRDLSFLLISDIQLDRYTGKPIINQFKDAVHNTDADITIFTGDLITSGQYYIDEGLKLLCNIPDQTARIACIGDHDHWSNPGKISNGLNSCEWIFLRNEHHLITHNSKKILITGITQIYSQRISTNLLISTLKHAPEADLKILIVHQPSWYIIRQADKYGYHVIMAGHTHGGQIVFHPFGFPLTPSQFENPFYSGLHYVNSLAIVITNGIGLTLAPVRYHAPAEITLINFTDK